MELFKKIKLGHKFLIISLGILGLFYLLNTVYIKYRISNWYSNYIDKDQSGLRIFYYSDDSFTNFETSGLTKRVSYSDSTDNQFKRKGFSLRIAGIFTPPVSGHYKFFLKSDDGSSLYIDNEMVIDNGGIHPACEIPKTVFFKKGPHLIVIEYFQALGKAELDFSWLKTKKTERDNDLELFFSPVISSFQWEKDIIRLQKIIKWQEETNNFLLFLCAVFIFIWAVLRFIEDIYSIGLVIWTRCVYIFKKVRPFWIVILLIIILAINFYPVFFQGRTLVSDPGSRHVHDGGGPFWQIEPYLYLNHYYYFKIKTVPLWNPYEGAGFPLAAMLSTGSFSPFGFLQSLYPSQLIMDFFMLFRLFLMGFFMYLFLREIKINSFASFIGSCYFMLAPPQIACINQFQMDTVTFAPAILYFLEKTIAHYSKKGWVLVAVLISLAILGGNPEECFLVMSLVTLYLFVRILFINNYSKIRNLKNYFIAMLVSFSLISFFLFPVIEHFMNLKTSGRHYSMGIDLNLSNLIHLFFTPDIPHKPPSTFSTLYISIIAFYLVLITISALKKMDRASKGYVLFSFIYFIYFLAMLYNNPLTIWLKKLPFIFHIWWSKYTSTFYIALTVIISLGMHVLIEFKDYLKRINLAFRSIPIVILFIFTIYYSPVKEEFKENPIFFYYLFTIIICMILILKRNIMHVVLIGLLLLVEIFLFIPKTNRGRRYDLPYTQAVVYLKKLLEKDLSRVCPIGINNPLEANRNCIYQIPIFNHSGIIAIKRYDDYRETINYGRGSIRSFRKHLDFFGIKYVYGNIGPIFEEDLKEIFRDGNEYIYENKRVFSRVFIVHRAEKMLDSNNILRQLNDPNFDLRHNIIVEEDLPSEMLECRGSPIVDNSYARIVDYTPNKVLIRAVLENDGFLVLSDTYYPGWKAYVDGKKTDIYLTNYLVRSVYLENGRHIVEFRYLPFTFLAGLAISFVSALYLFIIWRP